MRLWGPGFDLYSLQAPGSQPSNAGAFLIGTLLLVAMLPSAFAQGTVTLTPASLSFGNHQGGGPVSAGQDVTLTNTQTVPVSITSVSVSGGNAADFTPAAHCPPKLAAGQSCKISITFLPSALGSRTTTLTVTDSSTSSPQTVTLTGTGISPATIAPASLTFIRQPLNTPSVAESVTLTNDLNSTLSVPSASASGAFSVTGNSCSPSVGAKLHCSIQVTFTPTVAGLQTGTLSINGMPGGPVTVALNGTGVTSSTTGWGNIQHVVIIFQENRTPDNLFQDPVLIAKGADIASSGLTSSGAVVPLAPMDLGTKGSSPQLYDLEHAYSSFVVMYDGGKMDGANKISVNCLNSTPCPLPNAQFKYVLPADVAPYFQMAEQYTFGDRMFQTNQGPSFPSHQFIISGTSAPTATSTSFASSNLTSPGPSGNGCLATPESYVVLLDPLDKPSPAYPCFEHPTLTDLLDDAGVTWRYYYAGAVASLWSGPVGIEHMCVPNVPPPNATSCTGPDWGSKIVPTLGANKSGVLADIAKGELANVSWVTPSGLESDHASTNDGSGPSWVASIVNAIGSSSYWSNTAIIITWDDWGGWYDHVAPKVINDGVSWGSGYVYGFRVPLIVISPYANPGYVSHVTHDFGSVLNMVEQVFNLPSLGYADAHADDLSDCFNFNQTPIQFQTIAAPIPAEHFLDDTVPQTEPDDD